MTGLRRAVSTISVHTTATAVKIVSHTTDLVTLLIGHRLGAPRRGVAGSAAASPGMVSSVSSRFSRTLPLMIGNAVLVRSSSPEIRS